MNLNAKEIKNLLKKYHLSPFKKLGQNFLVCESIFQKIIKSASLNKEDIVIEIGAGIGNLTLWLGPKAKRVIAIEKDKKLIPILKEVTKEYSNITIISEDVRKLKPWLIVKSSTYKVVANIPYYLTSFLIRQLLSGSKPPKTLVLLIQKEVGEKIISQPPKMNLLALSVSFFGRAEIISTVPRTCFWPRPKVASAIIRIIPKQKEKEVRQALFFKIARAGFSHPRKTLVNNLSFQLKLKKEKVRLWLLANKIDPFQRPQELSLSQWINLTKTFSYVS